MGEMTQLWNTLIEYYHRTVAIRQFLPVEQNSPEFPCFAEGTFGGRPRGLIQDFALLRGKLGWCQGRGRRQLLNANLPVPRTHRGHTIEFCDHMRGKINAVSDILTVCLYGPDGWSKCRCFLSS